MKRCTKCGEAKSPSEFYSDKRREHRLMSRCKSCLLEATAAYCRNNPEKRRATSRAHWVKYYAENRQHLSERAAAYSRANREKINERHRATGTNTAKEQRRRARLRAATGRGLSAEEWLAICAEHDGRCAYCLQRSAPLAIEHVIPLARGGEHDVSNIVPACTSCNASKNARGPIELLMCPELLVTQRMIATLAIGG